MKRRRYIAYVWLVIALGAVVVVGLKMCGVTP